MPAQTNVGTRIATTVAAPGRLRLMAALSDGPKSGATLASSLGTDARAVARHALPLERLGLVTRTVGTARDRVYKLVREPFFSDDAWDQLPIPARRAAAASALSELHAVAAAAIDDGGFDRREIHLTRTALELDERGWRRASEILLETYERLRQLAPESADSSALRATAVMMLFTAPQAPVTDEAEHEAVEFSEEEALRRTTHLVEELHELVTYETTAWESIVAIVDQLRVVSRAGMLERSRPGARAVTERQPHRAS
jgi:DNA-binding transcriptional ArsR family regulator